MWITIDGHKQKKKKKKLLKLWLGVVGVNSNKHKENLVTYNQ